MTVKKEGPQLEYLLRRLAECPSEFILPADKKSASDIFPPAVIGDCLKNVCGVSVSREKLAEYHQTQSGGNRNWINLTLISCWLYYDEWFISRKLDAESVLKLFDHHFASLAKLVKAELFLSDPDRREEFVRLCLDAVDVRPSGESETLAADRLKTLDSIERDRVIKAAKAAEKRAAEIRIAMAKQEAIEAASKMPRE